GVRFAGGGADFYGVAMRADQWLIPWYFVRACQARAWARRHGLPSLEIDRFGRKLGWRMCAKRTRGGIRMLLQPIDFLRYYEFDFVAQAVRNAAGNALDVSSPSLFSL